MTAIDQQEFDPDFDQPVTFDEGIKEMQRRIVEEVADFALLVVLAVAGATFNAMAAAFRGALLVAEAALRIATGAPTPEDDPELAQILAVRDAIVGAR